VNWKRIVRILSLALIGFASYAVAQIDIPIGQVGPYITLARNVTWTGSGITGLNNNYIFTPTTPDQGVCFYFENTDTVAHTFSFAIAESGNPAQTLFAGNTLLWVYLVQTSATVQPNSDYPYFIKASGAARLALQVTNGTSTGAANVYAVFTNQNCGRQTQTPLYCPFDTSLIVATGTSGTLVTGAPSAGVHICSYMVTIGGATVTSATNTLTTATSCGTPLGTVTQWRNGAVPAVFAQAGSGQDLFPQSAAGSGVMGRSLCYTDGGTTSGSTVHVTYAQF